MEKYHENPEKFRKISLQKNVSDKVIRFKKSIDLITLILGGIAKVRSRFTYRFF